MLLAVPLKGVKLGIQFFHEISPFRFLRHTALETAKALARSWLRKRGMTRCPGACTTEPSTPKGGTYA